MTNVLQSSIRQPESRVMTWILPIKTISEANASEHWTKRAKRRKQQGLLVRIMLKKELEHVTLPCHITLTRMGPRFLDVDNLPMSMKSLTDELADMLVPEKGGWYVTKAGKRKRIRGHSDSDKRLAWSYGQEKWLVAAVRLEIAF